MMSGNKNTINTALLAYGLSGRAFHAPLLTHHPGFQLTKIWVRSGRQHPEERYPEIEIVNLLEDILNDETVDLVVVNTPEHTHYELAKTALLSGKNVIVEKAFTVSVAEAEELIQLAKEKNKMLTVFHNSRWHGDYKTICDMVHKKLLGELVEYEAHFDRFRNFIQESWKEEPKPGTGSLYNLGPHLIDQALNLFGWPKSIWAHMGIQRPQGKVTDHFELILFYDHLKVTLKSSYLVKEAGPRYILHGTEGSFIKYGSDSQETLLNAGKSPLDEDFGTEEEKYWGKLNTQIQGLRFEGKVETKKGSYMDYYDNIYDVIKKNKELIVKPEHALQTIKIIEAAIKSSKEKRVITF